MTGLDIEEPAEQWADHQRERLYRLAGTTNQTLLAWPAPVRLQAEAVISRTGAGQPASTQVARECAAADLERARGQILAQKRFASLPVKSPDMGERCPAVRYEHAGVLAKTVDRREEAVRGETRLAGGREKS